MTGIRSRDRGAQPPAAAPAAGDVLDDPSPTAPPAARWARHLASPYAWFIPIFLIMGVVLAYPWAYSLYLSFHDWTPLRPDAPQFVAFDNFRSIIADPLFLASLRRTSILVVTTVICQLLIGMGVAVALDALPRYRALFVTPFLIPFMLTPSVVAMAWRFLLHEQWGVFNWVLRSLGFDGVGWLSDPSVTLTTIIIIDIWHNLPFAVLMFLAGLQAIPSDPMESALVDRANAWQVFRYVKLPYLAPLVVTVLLFRLIFSLRTFDVIYALFLSGGPANAGMVVGVYLYESLRVNWQLGYASAISYVLLLLTMLVGAFVILRWYRSVEGQR